MLNHLKKINIVAVTQFSWDNGFQKEIEYIKYKIEK